MRELVRDLQPKRRARWPTPASAAGVLLWLIAGCGGPAPDDPAARTAKDGRPVAARPDAARPVAARPGAARPGAARPDDDIRALAERVAAGGAEDPDLHHALAALHDRAGDKGKAEHHYREALRLRPDHLPATLDLSRLLMRSGRYPETLEVLRQGVARSPGDLRLRTRYAEALIMLRRRWAEAEAELERALALPDPGAHPYYLLGLVYLNTGRPAAARRVLARAAELAPEADHMWYQLAHACEQLGELEARDAALDRFTDSYRRQLDGGGPPDAGPADAGERP